MKTIAIMNFKGGVGKTVTTINMAAELAARGKRVVVIDADGQRNLSSFFGADTESGGTLYEVLTGEAEPYYGELLQHTQVERVSILPASMELIHADLSALKDGTINLMAVSELVATLAEDDAADFVLVDCPPSFSASTTAALAAADEVIIPLRLDAFSLAGMDELLYQIKEMRRVNPRLKVAGVLVTMRFIANAEAQAEAALRKLPVPVFKQTIRRSVVVEQSTFMRETLRKMAPESAIAQDYAAVVDEYLTNGGAAR